MKKLLLFAIAFMLFSCSSGDDETKSQQLPNDKTLLLSIKKNGIFLHKYSYDNTGNLKETSLYDNSGKYGGKIIYDYENGIVKKQTSYDLQNNIVGYHLYTTEAGKIIKDTEYNSQNVKQDEYIYFYNAQNYLIEKHRPSLGYVIKYSYIGEFKYEYDLYINGIKVTHAVIYTDDKSKADNFQLYGKGGEHNDIKYEYNFYDTGNKETRYSTFTYNSKGYPIKEVTNKMGSIINTFEYEWSK